jgi:hypothetical protein
LTLIFAPSPLEFVEALPEFKFAGLVCQSLLLTTSSLGIRGLATPLLRLAVTI